VIEMMFWYGGHWAFWQVSLMWVGMIVFWGLLIWAVYALIKAATRGPARHRDEDGASGARPILDERLARGEIDEAEYQRLLDLLGSPENHKAASTGSPR